MPPKTCAACDRALDDNPSKIKIGGRTVELCCEPCARRLSTITASQLSSNPALAYDCARRQTERGAL